MRRSTASARDLRAVSYLPVAAANRVGYSADSTQDWFRSVVVLASCALAASSRCLWLPLLLVVFLHLAVHLVLLLLLDLDSQSRQEIATGAPAQFWGRRGTDGDSFSGVRFLSRQYCGSPRYLFDQ